VLVSVSFHFFVIDILAKLVFFNLLELREAAQSKQTKLKLKCLIPFYHFLFTLQF
jgi:hypothetical protein